MIKGEFSMYEKMINLLKKGGFTKSTFKVCLITLITLTFAMTSALYAEVPKSCKGRNIRAYKMGVRSAKSFAKRVWSSNRINNNCDKLELFNVEVASIIKSVPSNPSKFIDCWYAGRVDGVDEASDQIATECNEIDDDDVDDVDVDNNAEIPKSCQGKYSSYYKSGYLSGKRDTNREWNLTNGCDSMDKFDDITRSKLENLSLQLNPSVDTVCKFVGYSYGVNDTLDQIATECNENEADEVDDNNEIDCGSSKLIRVYKFGKKHGARRVQMTWKSLNDCNRFEYFEKGMSKDINKRYFVPSNSSKYTQCKAMGGKKAAYEALADIKESCSNYY
jgi:hypothetical protein